MNEPKIRFKGFQGEWVEKALKEVAPLQRGFDLPSHSICRGLIPIAYSNGVLNYHNIGKCYAPGLVTGRSGTIGKFTFIESGMYWPHNTSLWVTNFFNNVPKYIYYMYHTIGIEKYSTGSGVPTLNRNDVHDIIIYCPSIAEQQSIADYFTNLDTLIQSTTKKIESLKQVKAASLQSMFPQEGETTPRVRFKGFEGEWEKVLIGKMGVTYSGLSGKTKDDFGFGEARFITFLNVLTNAKIDTSILEPVNVNGDEHQNEVRKGDLLFNTSSETPEEVGMCAVMDEILENVYLNSFCFGFRVTDNNIDPTCVAYIMRSHIGRRIMSILAQGATRYNLSKNSFCKAVLVLPKNIAEQRAIASYFTNLDRQINLQTQRLEKLKQIKAACLDNMFV